jgi:hypothetical protein
MTKLHIQKGYTALHQHGSGKALVVKRCPECFTNLSMSATVCPWCSQKLKNKVNKHGYAKKPIDWYAYIACFLSWVGVAIYIWWAFFR